MSQYHRSRPKRDSIHGFVHQVNPRQVGSNGAAIYWAYYHYIVSKWKYLVTSLSTDPSYPGVLKQRF